VGPSTRGTDQRGQGYYEARRDRLLRGFDRVARRAQPSIARYHGAEVAEGVIPDARAEFERLIPELPYIGGWRNVFTPIMVISGWMIALLRAMEARGASAEDAVRVCAEVSDGYLRGVPGFVLRLAGRIGFTRPLRALLESQARRSRARRYEADFVYSVQQDGGDGFALVFDECAVNKFLDAQGADELKPYCNFFDVSYSRLMGMGVDASETIGLGCETCSLRYKHGRETEVPDRLRGVLPRTVSRSAQG
jgi:hypothetical protein